MDYSLLLGIYYDTGPEQALKVKENMKRLDANPYRIQYVHSLSIPSLMKSVTLTIFRGLSQNCFQKDNNGIIVTRPDGVQEHYYLGIIDILVQFGSKKKAESLLKSVVYAGVCYATGVISCHVTYVLT